MRLSVFSRPLVPRATSYFQYFLAWPHSCCLQQLVRVPENGGGLSCIIDIIQKARFDGPWLEPEILFPVPFVIGSTSFIQKSVISGEASPLISIGFGSKPGFTRLSLHAVRTILTRSLCHVEIWDGQRCMTGLKVQMIPALLEQV